MISITADDTLLNWLLPLGTRRSEGAFVGNLSAAVLPCFGDFSMLSLKDLNTFETLTLNQPVDMLGIVVNLIKT